VTQKLHSVSISFVPELIHGNEFDQNLGTKGQQQDPQQKPDQGQARARISARRTRTRKSRTARTAKAPQRSQSVANR